MARQDIVVFDPDERPVPSLESMVRPTQPNIIQIQMRGLDEYEMNEAPDKMLEFSDHELLATRLKMKIRKALSEIHGIRRPPDLQYETDTLCERAMSLMSNYKIANVDLVNRTAVKVVPELDVPNEARPPSLRKQFAGLIGRLVR